ncbi:MAG: SH3 domain-containing protein, partial [Bacteroidaceae bacterium]|nr:SH3 domain-containing protein [Bacteroidaceae bacterium]
FLNQLTIRKVGFYSGIVLFFICIIANGFAYHEKVLMLRHDTAVVMQQAVHVKSTPTQDGKDLFVLHEGTKMTVTDDSMRDWKEIRLDDGKVGWMESSAMEVI